jgi:serine/threonine protein kinase
VGGHHHQHSTNFEKKLLLLQERLQVAVDIAGALAYMHQKGIMHRDLEPANVGFDVCGNLKIFNLHNGTVTMVLPPKQEQNNNKVAEDEQDRTSCSSSSSSSPA